MLRQIRDVIFKWQGTIWELPEAESLIFIVIGLYSERKKYIYMDLSLNYFYKTSQIISLLLLQVCCLRRLNFTEFKRKGVTSKFDKFRALLRTKQVFWNWLSELQSIKVYETYFCLCQVRLKDWLHLIK